MGKKMAVLAGCNYPNGDERDKLHGCHKDVLSMRELLVSEFSFSRNHIVLMIDKPGSPMMPTHANIMKALNQMIDEAQPHDILFFHFSGHGSLVGANQNVEAIVPSDDNPITKMDFRHLVHRLPKNVTFTILADSCCSGGLIDNEPEQIGPRHPAVVGRRRPPAGKPPKMIPVETLVQHFAVLTGLESPDLGVHLLQHFGPDNCSILFRVPPNQHPEPLKKDQAGCILLSACQSNEGSADTTNGGVFTNAVHKIVKENNNNPYHSPRPRGTTVTNRALIIKATNIIFKDNKDNTDQHQHQNQHQQHPCLYCSKANADREFLGNKFHHKLIN